MNRIDRMLAIVLELQARKQLRAEDLAATFQISKRTVYRDLMALADSGVPIVAIPGQGYSLVEGYFLPPLTFNTDEAIMLMLGSDVVGQHFDAQYRGAAQSARHKIVAVLPEALRQEVEYLESSIQLIVLDGPSSPETLLHLRRAILQRRTVRFRYQTRYRDEKSNTSTRRDADPYALIHIGGAWMMTAYCHERREIRHFRLDRMEEVSLLNRVFTRPEDFKIELSEGEDRTLVVRVLFDHETAPRIKETPSLFQVEQEEQEDGLMVTLIVRQPSDILNWLLSWGSHVRVLEPEALCDLLTQEAEGILKHYSRDFSRS